MKLYKIKHLPTDLFYKPSTYGSKSNLSNSGKVYQKKPSLRIIGHLYKHPIPRKAGTDKNYEWRKFNPTEWEVIELRVKR